MWTPGFVLFNPMIFLKCSSVSSGNLWNPQVFKWDFFPVTFTFVCEENMRNDTLCLRIQIPPLEQPWCWQRWCNKMTKYYSPVGCDNSIQSEWNRHTVSGIYNFICRWHQMSRNERNQRKKMLACLVCIYETILLIKVYSPVFTWPCHRSLARQDSMIGIPNWPLSNVKRYKVNTWCT